MKIISAIVLLLGCLLMVSGCGNAKIGGSGGDQGVSIRGKIVTLDALQGIEGKRIMVEGLKENDTDYDKASIKVTNSTKMFRLEEGKTVKVSMDELKLGQQVEVVFVGPVAESYPVQATAGQIVILEYN
jgi:beta-N-acetylhexosaminidase